MLQVGIVGGTGYTGVELLRLLSLHPQVQVACVTSRAEAGRRVDALYPSLRGRSDLVFCDPEQAPLGECDIVFFATPHATAMHHVPSLCEKGIKVIDLSADFRLQDIPLWEQWYQCQHSAPQWVKRAVYGLPELHREAIRSAQLVACPGCYPTAVQLGFAPLLEAGAIDASTLIADAKSGVTGAGRGASVATLFSETSDSFSAYGVAGHRHLPEIQQGLSQLSEREINLTFVPHLVPMLRGIHATLYATLTQPELDLQALFEARYQDEACVDVMPAGSHPQTRSVRGANICRLAVHRPRGSNQVVVLAVEDNLVKGASGQAVQCMNIMAGLPETLGLEVVPLMP